MCKIYMKISVGLTPLSLNGEEGLISILPDHLLYLVQQGGHTPVLPGDLTVQDVVIVPTVLK